jgi:hypothetical protein
MAVTWEYHGSILVVTASGVYENRDIERAFDEAFADPQFGPATRLLMDGRGSETALSAEDIAWREEFLNLLPGRGMYPRAAFLIRSGHAVVQVARVEIARKDVSRPLESGLFTDEAEALTWLQR